VSLPARAILPWVALPLFGCAAALSEPPSLTELTQAPRTEVVDIDTLLAEAETRFAARTVEDVRRAAELWRRVASTDEARIEGLIGAARAWIWLSGHESEPGARLDAAVSAVQAAQWCERLAPDDPSCIYQLALALGVQARERRVTGHDALKEMTRRLEDLVERAPALDHGGPHRVLALVLLRAPGWPAGPGDPDLALEHAVNAVHIDPDFPPNRLCLAEALGATGSKAESFRAYRAAGESARAWLERGEFDAREWLDEAERELASDREHR